MGLFTVRPRGNAEVSERLSDLQMFSTNRRDLKFGH